MSKEQFDKIWSSANLITWDYWYDTVDYPLAQQDASLLCSNLITLIQKKGEGRSRDEGVKMLKRVRDRFTEDFNRRALEVEILIG